MIASLTTVINRYLTRKSQLSKPPSGRLVDKQRVQAGPSVVRAQQPAPMLRYKDASELAKLINADMLMEPNLTAHKSEQSVEAINRRRI
jgi:hypothetical protein